MTKEVGKVWFWTRNNSQKSITLSNSRPLYMVNKNILLFYFIKIFYVSKLAIKVSLRDVTEGHIWPKIKIDCFSQNFGYMVEVHNFLSVKCHMLLCLVYLDED